MPCFIREWKSRARMRQDKETVTFAAELHLDVMKQFPELLNRNCKYNA